MNRRRYDGAAYLAGYAVECILKTLIQLGQPSGTLPRALKIHDINELSKKALSLATLPCSRTARYFPLGSSVTSFPYGNLPLGWKETLRYYHEGTIPQTTASAWLSEVKRLYEHVLWGLIKDGEVTS
jgi:hypothetical protein